ncbi:hypothetical protein BGZ65_011774 [Modicella reniformis]|uniref:Phosphatidate phosphatase APP1 catalytic domain-containing protein n=1 Tax=Modicella reniformis TaxID=1440133 RepID=A0A9P6J3F6_9FUNG|nr:hypothetical protein BGZ65_011774 [Modicella reniformis]
MPSPSHGVVNLIDPKGISIISDIDDTIKETNVTAGARIILRNTFLRDMQDVKGMADVYRKWCNQGAAVHYVSNSPWQLIPSLLQFFHNHRFPPGSAHLRLHGNVIKTYFMQPGENKRKAIREILEDFPERKFILVGDSGEIDMEIYTAMAVKYPYQVQKIFIRDITTARLRDMASRTSPSRTLSLSSLLPKTATGARLFSRTTTSTISSTTITGDGDNTEDIPRTSSPEELSVDDPVTMEEGTPFARLAPGLSDMASASPKDEPSGSLTPPTVLTAASTSSPLNSPRLQPKQITTGFKVKSSPLSFKRSSSNDRNKKSGELGSIGTRARANTISPSSTLSTESVSNEYPFPRRGSVASSSADTSILQQSDNTSWDHDNQAEQFISSSLTSAALSTSASHSHVITHVITHCQTSISSSTFSKGLLELWLERVDQCRQKLPEGVLTLFESAEELEQCPIVKNLFKEHADDVQQVNKQEEGDCEDKEQEQEEVENGQGIEDNVSGRMEGLTSDTCLQEAAFDSIKIQNIGVADDTCVVTCIV